MKREKFAKIAATAVLIISLTAAAGPRSNPIAVRVAGYKDLGATYKAVNDSVRRGSLAAMPGLAVRIVAASRAQYDWFPPQSGPRQGVKTAAKPEIWTRVAEFRAAQDRFAAQALAFQRAAASGNATTIRSASRQLGASCKGCHDNFRVEQN
ncbi:MAG: cytochrome c [Novosphingobium sp.]